MLSLFQSLAQLPQGHIRLHADLLSNPLLHRRGNPAHRPMPPHRSIHLSGTRPAGGNLFCPTQTHSKMLRLLFPRAFPFFVGLQKLPSPTVPKSSRHPGNPKNPPSNPPLLFLSSYYSL